MELLDSYVLAFVTRCIAMTPQTWFNFGLAFGAAMVAFGAINRMTEGTDAPIIFSFVTVGSGMIGAALSYFMPDRWQIGFDTLVYGGILALLIGTRRQTLVINPRWMPVISKIATAGTWLVFVFTVQGCSAPPTAAVAPGPNVQVCAMLPIQASNSAGLVVVWMSCQDPPPAAPAETQ